MYLFFFFFTLWTCSLPFRTFMFLSSTKPQHYTEQLIFKRTSEDQVVKSPAQAGASGMRLLVVLSSWAINGCFQRLEFLLPFWTISQHLINLVMGEGGNFPTSHENFQCCNFCLLPLILGSYRVEMTLAPPLLNLPIRSLKTAITVSFLS